MKHWMHGMVSCRHCGKLFRRSHYLNLHVYQMTLPLWLRALRMRRWALLAHTNAEALALAPDIELEKQLKGKP